MLRWHAALLLLSMVGCVGPGPALASLPGGEEGAPEGAGYLGVQGVWLGEDVRAVYDAASLGRDMQYLALMPGTHAFGSAWDLLAARHLEEGASAAWFAGWIEASRLPVLGEAVCIHAISEEAGGRVCSNVEPTMRACPSPLHEPVWDPRPHIEPPAATEVLFITYDRGHGALISCEGDPQWHWTVTRVVGDVDRYGWHASASTVQMYHEFGTLLWRGTPTWSGPGHDVQQAWAAVGLEPVAADGDVAWQGPVAEVKSPHASLYVQIELESPLQVADAWSLVGPTGERFDLERHDDHIESLVPYAAAGTWRVETTVPDGDLDVRLRLVDVMT